MFRLAPAVELLQEILSRASPAEREMQRYFRERPALGARERRELAQTVYACLRHQRLFAHLAGSDDLADVVAVQRLRAGDDPQALARAGFRGDARALAARVGAGELQQTWPFAVRASLPDWLAGRLAAQYGESEAETLARALDQPAPVDLRVNTLKTGRTQLRARLLEEGFACEPTPWSPVGLRLAERAAVVDTSAFRDGWFEVQDEGSQLLSLLLEPGRGEVLIDCCAGAGGKSLHLGALSANTGMLYAFDVSAARLERLGPRARRAGVTNVRATVIAHERDARLERLHGKADRVLVDAPCSGTGRLRRHPELKWRPVELEALAATQQRLLAAAAALVRPGGRLVYATCSLLREENEAIVAAFRATHPAYTLLPAGEVLTRRHVPLPPEPDGCLRLLPHRHGTDGFFAAVLERKR